jgi:RNA polymerase sigma-B factor
MRADESSRAAICSEEPANHSRRSFVRWPDGGPSTKVVAGHRRRRRTAPVRNLVSTASTHDASRTRHLTDAAEATAVHVVGMSITSDEVSDCHGVGRPDVETRSRSHLIETHTRLAASLARRFVGRGEELDDLRQVAMVALVNAADRFDPSLAYAFSTFATPTIIGALKRHLRDRTWAIRPPRSLQERYLEVNAAIDALTGALRRVPETAEVAEYGKWSEREVRDALAERLHRNLEHWDSTDDGGRYEYGAIEPDYARIEDRRIVDELLREIEPRERAIVEMRIFGDWHRPKSARASASARCTCADCCGSASRRCASPRYRRGSHHECDPRRCLP